MNFFNAGVERLVETAEPAFDAVLEATCHVLQLPLREFLGRIVADICDLAFPAQALEEVDLEASDLRLDRLDASSGLNGESCAVIEALVQVQVVAARLVLEIVEPPVEEVLEAAADKLIDACNLRFNCGAALLCVPAAGDAAK